MNLNKTFGRVATTLVAGAMLTALAMPAYAATPTGTGTLNTMSFDKTLTVNNTTYGPSVEFTYAITGTSGKEPVNGVVIKGGVHAEDVKINGTEETTDDKAVFVAGETVSNGKITKLVSLDFSGVDFPEPGIYRYKVTETFADAEENPDIVNGTNTVRYVDVTVKNEMQDDTPTGKLVIGSYQILGSDASLVYDPESKEYSYEGGTAAKSNGYEDATYTTYDLTLDKVVKGDMGNKGEEFNFTIEFTDGDAGEKFSYGGQEYTFNDQGKVSVTNIMLADATAAIKITGLPSDLKYKVIENVPQSEGYVTTAIVNNASVNVEEGQNAQTVAEQQKSQKQDDVVVTNTRNAVSPTGIVMNVAPYVLLVVVAAAGCFVFLRKRRED